MKAPLKKIIEEWNNDRFAGEIRRFSVNDSQFYPAEYEVFLYISMNMKISGRDLEFDDSFFFQTRCQSGLVEPDIDVIYFSRFITSVTDQFLVALNGSIVRELNMLDSR